jgi:hypothetical protein
MSIEFNSILSLWMCLINCVNQEFGMTSKKRENYRDAGNGKYISKEVAKKSDPRTWVKEVEKISPPKKK